MVLSALLFVGCGAEPPVDSLGPGKRLVAVRPYGGAWQTVVPVCDSPIETPVSEAFELVTVSYSPTWLTIDAVQAGPADRVSVTIPCPTPPYAYAPVQVIGAPRAVFDVIGQSAAVEAPVEQVWLPTSEITDVVAFTTEALPERFLLERAVAVTREGILLDFASRGQPLEFRPVGYQGQIPGEEIETDVVLTTAGGVTSHIVGPHSLTTPPMFSMVPTSALLDGDQEIFTARTRSGRSTTVDLRQSADGPVPIEFRPPIDSVTVSQSGDGVAIEVAASGTWNERHADIFQVSAAESSAALRTFPGWPEDAFRFTGLSEIPGWDPAWNLVNFGTTRWNVTVCDHQTAGSQCATFHQSPAS